ncbi:RNA polymerase II-associated factor 1 homolog [Harpegnathos saltator]|uniref:RNA polymerase II-associated factor 1 homolog n=1 Tax=Harpegnathos saltator TaxID=610380 RepID=E2B5A8_HARSA|nr:RNA polymerase II-associated factor 1 homolog [Harpegnathos saltator]XP_011145842.1 RNA polymerase II-associated factor 1 homolog [Harpegnathos saltator]EFN89122.1 RNA polymerase II-associated factor 1-like protein [Harpegnathos saltator]
MAPTIQTNQTERDKHPARPAEKRSELICRVKYCNTLPDIPFDPKFITYPFEPSRFIRYNPTSLERNYKYEVLTEHDLGVEIDLINKDTYAGDPNAQLDPADEKLLEEDVLTPQDSKRSRHHARSVSWLRRTEYISTETTRFQPQSVDKVEAKVGYSIKKNFKEETLYMDRESQIKAIEKTFEDNKKPIERHYSKPNVIPVEILPVYPDFKLWKYPCAQVIFDSDPAPSGRSVPAQIEEMSQAMIRGVMDESGEQFVAYFLPLEETLDKRRRDFTAGIDYADEEEYEYKMAREYNWNVKSKASKGYEENYFLVIRQDGVYYNELETRVRLSKRRQKAGQQPNNTRLIVRHRPLNAIEFRMQRYREKQLEPPGEDDEDEEEEEEEQEIQQEVEKADGKGSEGENEVGSQASSRPSSRVSSRKSRSRSKSASRSKSRSRSPSKSRSRSRSRSASHSLSRSRSRSGSPQSRNSSRSRSRSKSASRSRSVSPAKSPSPRSRSSSKSRSKSRSQSRSRSVSGSGSDTGSASGESGSESE